MISVLGVRFRRTGKVYYFDPGELHVEKGEGVIVETARGLEFGEVTDTPHEVPEEQVVLPLKKVIRAATEQDCRHADANREKEKEAAVVAEERIVRLGLEMKLVDVEYAFDSSKIIFYFTADGRVDFRELIKELAQHFHTRIELRQIGVRDETKMKGGLGPCGREICCSGFMTNFHPVSIKMAKEQNISLNPSKISGLCGRLMCCLEFEHAHYHDMRAKLPRKGADVMTPNGPGVVVENNVLEGKSRVRVTLPDKTVDLVEYPLEELKVISAEEREEALLNPDRFTMVEEEVELDEGPMVFADGSVGNDRPPTSQKASGSPAGSRRRNNRNRRSRNKGGAQKSRQDQGSDASGASGGIQTQAKTQSQEPAGEGSGARKKRRRRSRPQGENGQKNPSPRPDTH
ncbi:MAG: stage 0 sporulation family protein [Clostridiales bacterium]|nr:stage 0 sporulation family protein [Clostridiales bacterium]